MLLPPTDRLPIHEIHLFFHHNHSIPGAALQLRTIHLVERGPNVRQVSGNVSVHLLCEQSGAVGRSEWEGDRPCG